jgi:serine/threonine protein kinase
MEVGQVMSNVSSVLPLPLAPGQFRFQYVSTVPIGQGGLGRVFRVRIIASNSGELPVGSEWAIKSLNEKWNHHPEMRERFEREIGALKRMSHQNIVTCRGENLPGAERFYLMPLFASSVRKFIASGGFRGNWRSVASMGAVIADALHYAHVQGFIHRDLKPDNILFNANGPLVVADWGLGYFVHKHSQVLQHLTVGGMGTAYYCSVEQWATGKCDCRGDAYSLGMTLDEWVTGQQRNIEVGAGITIASVSDVSAGARRFNSAIAAMTARAKAARPASLAIVAAELRAIATS